MHSNILGSIKKKIDRALYDYAATLEQRHHLRRLSPILFKNISEFILREGKRIRPALFIIGYLGYGGKETSDLYRSALSIELLHDFMLIHDDIIDKSLMRRGKPSMHSLFNAYLDKKKNIKFNGEDLAIIAGDIIYAMAMNIFHSIKENPLRKEAAFKKLAEAALHTGSGEFIELDYGIKKIEALTENEIYRIYDLKTAHYTFSAPLSIGAILAGAQNNEIETIAQYGKHTGRAFQIKDDLLSMYGDEETIGKPVLSDLSESKKTLIMRKAYQLSSGKQKTTIKKILEKKVITMHDLLVIREIVENSGAKLYAINQIKHLASEALNVLNLLKIGDLYKQTLRSFTRQILTL